MISYQENESFNIGDNIQFIRKIPAVEELTHTYVLSQKQKESRKIRIKEIQEILAGNSSRKILCIGPCSADREDAVLDYMVRLAKLQEKVKEKMLFIPRVYTSKPRTNGCGYKGLLHSPNAQEAHDDVFNGLIATRKMHLHVINETGFFCADEMLYPEVTYYILDLLAYTAVGARSVENQQHRLVASGLDIPVGMKNPTSGDYGVLLNAIWAAHSAQSLFYHGWECKTNGNPYVHAILRGYSDLNGHSHVNYHFEDICDFYDLYVQRNLKNMSVLIDCNHSNSRKHYDEQCRISKEVLQNCKDYPIINQFVKGLYIESYLLDGAQMAGENVYGKSITDPCLGWDKTERLVMELCELI